MNKLKLTLSMVIALLLVGCGRVQPIMEVENTPVAYQLQNEQVKKAIVTAATKRGWIVNEIKPGMLKGSITVRSHFAEINMPYSNKYYSIHYVKSVNLKADDGKIHRNYNRWINNLNIDIQRQLALVATQQ
ncbi:hypothetical protein [Vibrio sp.]|uniref:hypothetical protein n=1 Tax=Vibrio sp. TaxID=678 RepID=UPI003D1454CF